MAFWLASILFVVAPDRFVDLKNPPSVIVPAKEAPRFYRPRVGGRDSTSFFTPSRAQVLRLQAGLSRYLKTAPFAGDLHKRVGTYHRHYLGVVLGGKRKIWANFYCEELRKDWRRSPVFVVDGGDCYFEVTFDLDTGEFSNFEANGEA